MIVWYTRGLSVTADALAMLRGDPRAAGLSWMASHADASDAVAAAADWFVVEPAGLDAPAYASWVLATAAACGVGLVVAQRRAAALWPLRGAFDAAGIRLLLPAAPEVLALLDDKAAFQADLSQPEVAAAGVIGHAVRRFDDLAGFDAAWRAFTDAGDARHGLCAKPVRGMFGAGFRRIEPDGCDMDRILSALPGDAFRLSLAAYRAALAGAGAPRPMILMPYLPGVERSVDFAARDGDVLCAVARAKDASGQRLEVAGPSIDSARVLARRYRLNGMCNLQTRESDGREAVLEINARMSGGLPMTRFAGVNLPLVAVLAALGRDLADLPAPRPGALVAMRPEARLIATPTA